MQKYSSFQSLKTVDSFLNTIGKDLKKGTVKIEFFELTIQEPHYEKLSCAYIRTNNQKEGILYEGVTNRFFYIKFELVNKSEKTYSPTLSTLTNTVSTLFPKTIKDKMFWVCGNKKDKNLEIEDFKSSFTLAKPNK